MAQIWRRFTVLLLTLLVLIVLFTPVPVKAEGYCGSTDLTCLLENYPGYEDWSNGDNGLCDPDDCNCSALQKSLEYPGDTNNFTTVSTPHYCEQDSDACIEYRKNNDDEYALLCYQEQLVDPDECATSGPSCSVTYDQITGEAVVNAQCFDTDTQYLFTVDQMNSHSYDDMLGIIHSQYFQVGSSSELVHLNVPSIDDGEYIRLRISYSSDEYLCYTNEQQASDLSPSPSPGTSGLSGGDPQNFDYCKQVPTTDGQRSACLTCVGKGEPGEYIFTAVGCVKVRGKGLAEDLIRILLGIAGGAAFMSMLASAFLLTTSRGETSKVKQAKEFVTAAVSGLLFIIFSIIILSYIGVNILQIPGLD